MKTKRIASAAVAAALALSPVQSTAGDALAGGIVGAVIGGLIVHEMHKNKSRPRAATTSSRSAGKPAVSSGQREANREVQTALNYFGYNVGTPDGSIGPKSRAGISQYQALMGYPPTGQLTDFERTVLTTAYQRGMIGGAATMQMAASHPMGTRGLLLMQRDEMAGLPGAGFGAPGLAAGALAGAGVAAAGLPAFAAAPQQPAAPAAPALPNFFGGAATMVSLASHCNKVSLLTNTNGGFVTAASMTDPVFALSEQFCLARIYAMAQGDELIAKVPGTTPQQVAEQCKALGPAMQDHVAALSLQDRDAVLQGVSGFVLTSGMQPAQLSATARICLGSGYTTDVQDVALGSALLLTVLGEKGYAELIGHHLAQGFGATQRPDLALQWYETSLDAGGSALFAPGMPERAALIRKAAFTLGGKADKAAVEPAPVVPVFAVPAPVADPAPAPQAALQTAAAEPPARTGVAALPLAARLPFMVFGN